MHFSFIFELIGILFFSKRYLQYPAKAVQSQSVLSLPRAMI